MEEIRREILSHKTIDHWQNLEVSWPQHFGEADALLLRDGEDEEGVNKLKTHAFHNWFFRHELINSVVCVSRKKLAIFASREALGLLSHLKDEAKSVAKEVVFVERGSETDAAKFLEQLASWNFKRFGFFQKEKQVGAFIDAFNEVASKASLSEVDVSMAFQEFLAVKDTADLKAIRTCASANNWLFARFIEQIEKILDRDKKLSHAQISRTMESDLDECKQKLERDLSVKPQFLDYTYSPVVQSGGNFDLRPNAEANDSPLAHDYILLNMATKYHELNTNVFRTLIIDPTVEDKENYNSLLEIHKQVMRLLVPDKKLSDVYNETIAFCTEKHPKLLDKLPTSFGFGIGYEFKEVCLLINQKNERVVAAGQVYTVITNAKGLAGRANTEVAMHLADTVIVLPRGVEIVTDSVPKRLTDIGYSFKEDENGDKEDNGHANGNGNGNNAAKASSANANAIKVKNELVDAEAGHFVRKTRAAKRGQEMAIEQQRVIKMREHQRELLEQKMAELEERLKSGNFIYKDSESSKIILEKLRTYTPENFPKNFSSNQIHVDTKNNAVLLPINGRLVPFHVACFKNVTKHSETKTATLRFNFQVPGVSAGNIVFPAPSSFEGTPIYIKELTFRSFNVDNFNTILKEIKDVQKKLKAMNTQVEHKTEKPQLYNKLKMLNELKMRPTLTGRKTTGSLTAYANGFKFVSKRNEIFELPLSNIKHAIFQPCDENMIIIIHFALRNAININKKPQQHIQFFIEVGYTSEDLHDPKKKGRMADMDEFEEEELERQARDHYNKLFLEFVSFVEKNWESDMKFDSPYTDYGFYGSHLYNNVFIMPTAYCLVALIDSPFLLISLEDIELVSFERVDNKIKNFDLIIVFKDYTRPVQTISNIPKTNIDTIKTWLE